VRHPNILSFLHSTEAEVPDGPAVKHTIYIVTEPVTPLAEKIKELNLGGTQRYHEIQLSYVLAKHVISVLRLCTLMLVTAERYDLC
jgi:hypothetical protein